MPGFRAWITGQRCVVPGCDRAGDPAHLPRVKSHGDVENIVPLCRVHHVEQHTIGRESFALKYALDLLALAREYWRRYLEVLRWETPPAF